MTSSSSSFLVLSVSVAGILTTSLLMLAYYLFLLCSCRRRRQQQQQPPAPSTQLQSRGGGGLEEAAIRRIPTVRYQHKHEEKEHCHCAVCLADFREGERLRRLPPCFHSFHIDCIDAWLYAAATCPLCRAPVAIATQDMDIYTTAININYIAATSIGIGTSRRQDDDDDEEPSLSGLQVQQPMRRSLSLDSCADKHLYLALQQQQQQHSAPLGCQHGKLGVSGRPLRRSFFSFSHARISSPTPILPI